MNIRSKTSADESWVVAKLSERWLRPVIIVNREHIDASKIEALIAEPEEGLLTYRIKGDAAEIVTLDAFRLEMGIGSRLIEALCALAKERNLKSLSVMTTNNNASALAFYQKNGFAIKEVRKDAIKYTRSIKPEIPEVDQNGVPIRDEIELVRALA
jgi:ribosomal protein S18 acetylase RimI-like enzyme